LRGGIIYHDGQFDDARLLINLVRTAAHQGRHLAQLCPVTQLLKDPQGYLNGVVFEDVENGARTRDAGQSGHQCHRPVLRRRAADGRAAAASLIAPSQGIHLVFDALLSAGRLRHHGAAHQGRAGDVRHSLPGRTLVGTTDTPIARSTLEPRPWRRRSLYPRNRRHLPGKGAHAAGHSQRVRRHPAAGQSR
jgi:glycerol-3-phosphate dehydrogenase